MTAQAQAQAKRPMQPRQTHQVHHKPVVSAVQAVHGHRVPVSELGRFNPAEKNRVRHGFIFDTIIYPAAGADTIALFSNQVGANLNDGSRAKTEEDTNLFAAGQLAQNQAMLVKGVEILFLPTTTPGHAEADATYTAATQKFLANDVAAFFNSGLLHLRLKGVDVLKDGPLMMFPPRTRIDGHIALANTDTDNNKNIELVNCVGHAYPLEPFAWMGGEVMEAKLVWPSGKIALPSGNTARVKVRLIGDIYEVK